MATVEPPKRIYKLESVVEFATMAERDAYARALRELEKPHGIVVKSRSYKYRFTHCKKCGRPYHLGNGLYPAEPKDECKLSMSASCAVIEEEKRKRLD